MAQKRQWSVPETLPDQDPEAGEVYPVDRQEAAQAFLELEVILDRLGGSMQIAPVRTEIGPDRWITRGYVFRHVPYVPAERQQQRRDPIPEEPSKVDEEEPVDGELVEA